MSLIEELRLDAQIRDRKMRTSVLEFQAALEIEILEKRVKELEQDKERLDWLQSRDGVTAGVSFSYWNRRLPAQSLRQAIDAARHACL